MQVREVIDIMMACTHRHHLNDPARPFLGCEVAMRFLSTTHQAASFDRLGGPPAFERYLKQPHKRALTAWRQYQHIGRPTVIERRFHRWEAYQQLKVRSDADESSEWETIRWLLIKEEGEWRIDGVYSEEPDAPDPTLYDDLREMAQARPTPPATRGMLPTRRHHQLTLALSHHRRAGRAT